MIAPSRAAGAYIYTHTHIHTYIHTYIYGCMCAHTANHTYIGRPALSCLLVVSSVSSAFDMSLLTAAVGGYFRSRPDRYQRKCSVANSPLFGCVLKFSDGDDAQAPPPATTARCTGNSQARTHTHAHTNTHTHTHTHTHYVLSPLCLSLSLSLERTLVKRTDCQTFVVVL